MDGPLPFIPSGDETSLTILSTVPYDRLITSVSPEKLALAAQFAVKYSNIAAKVRAVSCLCRVDRNFSFSFSACCQHVQDLSHHLLEFQH